MGRKLHRKTIGISMRALPADAPEGSIAVKFATLGVIDAYQEVVDVGSIGDQSVRVSAWGHNHGVPVVGKGATSEDDSDALFLGQYFLKDPNAQVHYNVAKELGELQEWSFAFYVNEWEYRDVDGIEDVPVFTDIEVVEVCQVMKGAGVDTHTIEVRSDETEGEDPLPKNARRRDDSTGETPESTDPPPKETPDPENDPEVEGASSEGEGSNGDSEAAAAGEEGRRSSNDDEGETSESGEESGSAEGAGTDPEPEATGSTETSVEPTNWKAAAALSIARASLRNIQLKEGR